MSKNNLVYYYGNNTEGYFNALATKQVTRPAGLGVAKHNRRVGDNVLVVAAANGKNYVTLGLLVRVGDNGVDTIKVVDSIETPAVSGLGFRNDNGRQAAAWVIDVLTK